MMDATKYRLKFEVEMAGDPGHVDHRTNELVNAMVGQGFRVVGILQSGGPIYLMADQEDAVDSSTVDGEAEPAPVVMLGELCGIAACGHDKGEHVDDAPAPAKAGLMAAQPGGTHCRHEVAPGIACKCPGFTPVTGNLLTDEGQAMLRRPHGQPFPY